MRRNSFFALLGLAGIAVAGAIVAVQTRDDALSTAPEQTALYPDLMSRINDADRVLVRSADNEVTLARSGDKWVMPDRANYPVDFGRVRNLLVQIARLETSEPRTSKAELYDRLDVQDIDQPDAKSVQVTIEVAGNVLADVIVGRSRPASEGGGLFVRDASEEQAWLARGDLRPDKQFVQWLDRNVVNVDQRRIQTATITHADGDTLTIGKDAPASSDFVLRTPVPDGRETKPKHELSPIASIPDFLVLEDVRPAAELKDATAAVKAEFRTFDGLSLAMSAIDQDGKTWVTVSAEAVPAAGELAAFVEANKGKDSAEGRTADQFKTSEDVAKQAEEINARVADWAYRLTDYKTGKLKSRLADVTQEIKKAEEPVAADKPADSGSDAAPGQKVN